MKDKDKKIKASEKTQRKVSWTIFYLTLTSYLIENHLKDFIEVIIKVLELMVSSVLK